MFYFASSFILFSSLQNNESYSKNSYCVVVHLLWACWFRLGQPVSDHICVCMCVGQSVKVGLAWSHDITRLRGLSASQTAPPLTPLPLTSLTPSQPSRGVRLSPSSTFYIWFQAKSKESLRRGRSVGVSSGNKSVCVCFTCSTHLTHFILLLLLIRFSYIIELLKNWKL